MTPKTILDREYFTNFDSIFVGSDFSCLLDFLPCYFHTKMFPMTQSKQIYQTMYINKDMLSKFDVFPVINYGGNVNFSVSYALRRITESSNVRYDNYYNTTTGGTEFTSFTTITFYDDISSTLNQYPTDTFILIFKLNFYNSTSFSGDNDFGEFLVFFSPVDSSVSKSNIPNVVTGQYKQTSKIDVKHISNMIFNYLSLNEDACFMVMRFDLQSYTFDGRIMTSSSYQILTLSSKNIARCIALVGNIENNGLITSIKANLGSQSFYGKPYGTSYSSFNDEKAKYNNLGFDRPILLVFNTDILSTINFHRSGDSPSVQTNPLQFLRYGYSDNVNDLVTGFYFLSSSSYTRILLIPFVFKKFETYTGQTITSFNFYDKGFHDRLLNYGNMVISIIENPTSWYLYCVSIVVLLHLLETGGIESSTKVYNCGTGCQPNLYYPNQLGLAPQLSSIYSTKNDFIYNGYQEYDRSIPYVDLLSQE